MPERPPREPGDPRQVERPPREIVSFVRRGDRLTTSRRRAWDRHHETYVLDVPRGERDTVPAAGTSIDPVEIFGRDAPLVVEVGSGLGENIAAAAARSPGKDFLACEVYIPGIAQTLDRFERAGLPPNVRILPLDAQRALPALLPPRSISDLWVFFPDPWHKARHHKRRLINPPFVEAISPLLDDGSSVHLATDWAQYALHMRQVLARYPAWALRYPHGPRPAGQPSDPVPDDMPATGWAPRFDQRVVTSFERKALNAGRLIWDLAYTVAASSHAD